MSDEQPKVTHSSTDEQLERNEVSIVAAGGWCAPSETICAISQRDLHWDNLWAGRVEPTLEERAEATAMLQRSWEEDMFAYGETRVFMRLVAGLRLTGLAAAIMEVHPRDPEDRCLECVDGWGESSVTWPCTTVRLVLKEVGVAVPDELVWEKPVKWEPDPDNPRWPFPATAVPFLPFPRVRTRRGGFSFG